MHERERHDVILATVQDSPVATVQRLVELTHASEATIRRDIAALHLQKKVRRVRGGAVAVSSAPFHVMAGRPFTDRMTINMEQKRAIAQRAVALCDDNEPIIINGGTTTFQMVPYLRDRRLQIFTNSFPIAESLLRQSQNTVMMPGGTIYRESNIILSPFADDVSRNFSARRMFMGAQGVSHARADGNRSAADPGRPEASRPGRRTGRSGQFHQILRPLEPDRLPAGTGFDPDHRRGN